MQCALMYHDVVPAGSEDSSGFPGPDAASYKITPVQFAQHLHAIIERCGENAGGVALTFDDGGASAATAADVLERHHLRGYFFITTDRIDCSGFVERATVRALRRRGHIVGSHSCSHPTRMSGCTRDQLLDEWSRSRHVLSNILDEPVVIASVPGGHFSEAVADTAREAGYTELFTSEPTDRIVHRDGLTIRGRFTVRRWTSAPAAAAIAAGDWSPRAMQSIGWRIKKICKQVGGERYLQVRRYLWARSRQSLAPAHPHEKR